VSGASHLDRFIRTSQRRLLWSRRIHRIEICLLMTSAIALTAAAILLILRQPSLLISTVILAAGCIVAIISAATIRLSALAAAIEMDRRLATKDLLATAISIRAGNSADQHWIQTILAVAEARCQLLPNVNISASKRAWIAISLAMLLVISLGLWISNPISAGRISLEANQDHNPFSTTAFPRNQEPPSHLTSAAAPPMNRPAGSANIDEASRRTGPSDSAEPGGRSTESAGRDHGASGHSPGAGGGLAQTPTQINPPTQPPLNPASANPTTTGAIAGGGANGDAFSPGLAAHGLSDSAPAPPVPPWQTPAWPAAQSAANASVDNGQIDPAYQDLVRDYFHRP
jgi:hypothetical protein